jgi:regulator of sigma E protease
MALLGVIAALGLVIFIHESGHFLMARRNGVRVHKFAIGFDFFGLKLASWKRGETEYVIGVFPLGGYVRMEGQDDNPGAVAVPEQVPPDSFLAKSPWQKTQIIAGGVIFNFLSAFGFCYLAFLAGTWSNPPLVGDVTHSALQAGALPGDRVVSVDGKSVDDWQGILVHGFAHKVGDTVPIEVDRDGRRIELELPVEAQSAIGLPFPGIGHPANTTLMYVEEDGPAGLAGFAEGETVVSVGGDPVETWRQIRRRIMTHPKGQPLVLTVQDESGRERELRIEPRYRSDSYWPSWDLGLAPDAGAEVQNVAPDGAAEVAGIQVGDRIVEVDGRPVGSWLEAMRRIAAAGAGSVPLTVDRGGERLTRVIETADLAQSSLWFSHATGMGRAATNRERRKPGFDEAEGSRPMVPVVPAIDEESPAWQAGLRPGDQLVEISVLKRGSEDREASEIRGWFELYHLLNQSTDGVVGLKVLRGEQEIEFPQVRAERDPEAPEYASIGVGYAGLLRVFKQVDPVAAIPLAFVEPFELLVEMVVQVRAMMLGRVPMKEVRGPIGIVEVSVTVAKRERAMGDVLLLLALISVNLAFLNFLPIPALDGGHFVLILWEALTGNPPGERFLIGYQLSGVVLLLGLMVLLFVNDLGRLFGAS